jgi:hypothetical protein
VWVNQQTVSTDKGSSKTRSRSRLGTNESTSNQLATTGRRGRVEYGNMNSVPVAFSVVMIAAATFFTLAAIKLSLPW